MQITTTKEAAEQMIQSTLENSELEIEPQELIETLKPIVELELVQLEDEVPAGESKFGGWPDVPAGFEYPIFEGQGLPFIAQFNLRDFAFDGTPLPTTGLLSFFADPSSGGENPKARDAWKVYFFENQPLQPADEPENLEEVYPEFSVSGQVNWTISENLSEFSYDLEEAATDLPFFAPNHYLLGGTQAGFQINLQGHLLELAESGVAPRDATKEQIEAARQKDDWIVLFSTDGTDTEMDWGSLYILYFWIRRSDLEARRFDRVWISGDVS
jgi:uncharacterized protein YwqG